MIDLVPISVDLGHQGGAKVMFSSLVNLYFRLFWYKWFGIYGLVWFGVHLNAGLITTTEPFSTDSRLNLTTGWSD